MTTQTPDEQPGAETSLSQETAAGKSAAEPAAAANDAAAGTGGNKPPRRVGTVLLSADAWVDTVVWRIGSAIRQSLENYDTFLRRFRVKGFGRAAAELSSDACTFGLLGLIFMLVFAQPAFEATRHSDWRTTDDFAVTFLDRFGKEIGRRGIVLNDTVPLEELPDSLVKATLATEDRRFFMHFGIDLFGTARAMVENVRARTVVQGGSSLTQQLAKNLFLSNERTLDRKIKEAFLALWLEANLTKREILKLYLDRAYMGGGVFGVAAAAEFYFNKNVRELTLAESAMLAGLYKAPTKYAPHVNLPAARARANEVLTNLVQGEFLTEGQVIGARRNPAIAVDRSADNVPEFYLDWAFEEVKRLARRRPELARDRIVTVRTTLDTALQRQAERAVESTLREHGQARDVEEAAMVAMLTDGAVRAMVGGRSYGDSQFNRAANALRQPGSSFKPFVYMTAFMNGYSAKSIVPDAPINIGGWSPRNYTRGYSGPVTLKRALTKSINTVPVRLAQAIGRDKIVETAYAMGITNELKISRSLPLGASDVTVLDMASSYATFANGGFKAAPYAILEVKNTSGVVLYDHLIDAPDASRILPGDKVAEMNDILVNVVQAGTGRRARVEGVVAAGKTGTTSAYRDAWFVGYTGNFSAAVWFGNDDFTATRRVTGGSLPAMTWQKFMAYAHEGIELKPMPGIDADTLARVPVAAASDVDNAPNQPRVLNSASLRTLRQLGSRLSALKPAAAARAPISGAQPGEGTVQ